jgi:hypothetical protein
MMLRLLLAFGGALAAASAAPAPATPAIAPTAPLALFDGRSLAAFDTWLVDAHRTDPLRVFSVVDQIDGQPAIRISGEQWGGLVTKRRFRDYRLTFEFRWGAITWGTRRNSARDSGVLLHCQGEFGNHTDDFNAPWMRSVEFQIIEGGTGDIILVGGFDAKGGPRLTPAVSATTAGKTRLFQPDGARQRFADGRVLWWGRDPQWTDTLGFRGPRDVERAVGSWNQVEITCRGGDVVFHLNGRLVNAATDSAYREGKLLFQSEGAEIFFRAITLHPLPATTP